MAMKGRPKTALDNVSAVPRAKGGGRGRRKRLERSRGQTWRILRVNCQLITRTKIRQRKVERQVKDTSLNTSAVEKMTPMCLRSMAL